MITGILKRDSVLMKFLTWHPHINHHVFPCQQLNFLLGVKGHIWAQELKDP